MQIGLVRQRIINAGQNRFIRKLPVLRVLICVQCEDSSGEPSARTVRRVAEPVTVDEETPELESIARFRHAHLLNVFTKLRGVAEQVLTMETIVPEVFLQ